jgi:diadenosine tetraphosphate (Ap4A) HIT family hydrolase
MLSTTLEKFQYPYSMIKEYKNWILLVRPMQVTLGSLILINRDESKISFGDLNAEDHTELNVITKEIENCLKQFINYEKINYLMLMMSDPEVHFHVIPRYNGMRKFGNQIFEDNSFPTSPDLSKFIKLEIDELISLSKYIKTIII